MQLKYRLPPRAKSVRFLYVNTNRLQTFSIFIINHNNIVWKRTHPADLIDVGGLSATNFKDERTQQTLQYGHRSRMLNGNRKR